MTKPLLILKRQRPQSPNLVPFALSQHISKLLQWIPSELRLLPQIWCQEAVAVADCHEGSFQCVLKSLSTTSRRSVCIFHTCELEKTFDCRRCDESGTAWSGDELKESVSATNACTSYVGRRNLTLTVTLPHFPLCLVGKLCGEPRLVPQ